jgi:hypothetical protein
MFLNRQVGTSRYACWHVGMLYDSYQDLVMVPIEWATQNSPVVVHMCHVEWKAFKLPY